MVLKIVAISAYVLMIVIVGLLGLRKTKSFTDFFLGGRKVGPWFTAFTYGTAYFSAVIFIGFAGKIGWGFGLSGLWIAFGNAFVGTLLVWLILGPKIREVTHKNDVHTMPEYLQFRYGGDFLKIYSAIAVFIFLIPYTSAVFMGLSYLFEATFGLPYWIVLISMGVFTGIYLVLGGYKSMTMIDFFFGIIMIFGVGTLLGSTITKCGGFEKIVIKLAEINPKLTHVVGPPGWWPLFSLVFLTSVAPFGMPQLLQKFYAIKDKRSIRIGMIASTLFGVLISGTAYFVGSLTRIFVNPIDNPNAFTPEGKPIFDNLMPELLSKSIPQSLTVVILLLILAASMSTLAALVLISSSTITKDLFAGYIKRDAKDKSLTAMMRIMSGIFLILSVILAFFKPAVIVTILSISWGAVASVFLGPFVWGILTKRAGKIGAIVSSVVGLATCLILYFIWGSAKAPQAGTIGMIVSLTLPLIFLPFGKKVFVNE